MLIATVSVISLTLAFLGIVPGMLTEKPSCPDVVYGETPEYSAKALLSDVVFEFASQDEPENWSDTVPVYAGAYRVRAISKNGYGAQRYSDAVDFVIKPAELELNVKNTTLEYGSEVEYSLGDISINGLVEGDTLKSANFLLNEESLNEITVSLSDIVVVNSAGEDVTLSYSAKIKDGSVVLGKRAVTIASKSASKEYDGVSLSIPGYDMTSGALAPGDDIKYFTEASVIEPGKTEGAFYVVITDSDGHDVTEMYDITYEYGSLEVLKRVLKVSVSGASKLYDGVALKVPEYRILSGSLPEGSTLKLNYQTATEITEVGEVEIHYTADVIDANGNVVTKHYSLETEAGVLKVTKRPIRVSISSAEKIYDGTPLKIAEHYISSGTLPEGTSLKVTYNTATEITEVGSLDVSFDVKVIDGSGKDVTVFYDISYDFATIKILKRPLKISLPTVGKLYDGEPLVAPDFVISSGSLPEGMSVKLKYTTASQITNVGEIEVRYTAVVSDKNGRDVSSNFDLSYDYGKLTVSKRPLYISVKSASKVYDGTPLKVSAYTMPSDSLPAGMTLKQTYTTATEITKVGSLETKFYVKVFDRRAADVTSNFDITYNFGILTVTKRPITFESLSITKVYDDTYLRPEKFNVTEGSLVDGDKADYIVPQKAEIKNVGTVEASFTVKISTSKGEDVTNQYNIKYIYGKLKITARPITIKTPNYFKTYDGTPIQTGGETIISGSLVSGHTLQAKYLTYIDVGDYSHEGTYKIFDSQSNEVTKNYAIETQFGWLSINPRNVTVISGSATKTYDGNPLTCNEYNVSGTLVSGHTLYAVMDGSRTNVGESNNTIKTIKVLDVTGREVTSNYSFDKNLGKLRVTDNFGNSDDGNDEPHPDGEDDTTQLGIPDPGGDPYAVFTIGVEKGGTVYLRERSYGDYTGSGFGKAPEYKNPGEQHQHPMLFAANVLAMSGNFERQNIYIGDYGVSSERKTTWMPYYSSNYQGGWDSNDIFNVGRDKRIGGYTIYAFTGYDYRDFEGLSISSSYKSPEESYRKFVYANYLDVPASTKSVLLRLAKENNISGEGFELIEKIQKYIQGVAEYSLETPAYPSNVDHVVYFLTVAKQGVCQQYAASATLMFRTLGIPARYTVGYKFSSPNAIETEVMNTDGHAWVEIYLDGIGWVEIEVTGGDGGEIEDGEGDNGSGDGTSDGTGEGSGEGGEDSGGDGSSGSSGSGDHGSETTLTIPGDQEDVLVFQVEAENGGDIYFRERSFGDYTGSGFRQVPEYSAKNNAHPMTFASTALASSGRVVTQSIRVIRPYGSENNICLVPYYNSNSNGWNSLDVWAGSNSSYRYYAYTESDFRAFDGVGLTKYTSEEEAYRKFVYANYLDVPESTKTVLEKLIKENGISGSGIRLIESVQKYVQGAAKYNLNAAPYPAGVDQVVHFLTVAKEGVCQQYAASATLIFRILGIPARYTVGYRTMAEAGVVSDVMSSQAHAWVEVYLDGVGWVMVEVTGSSDDGDDMSGGDGGSGSGEGEGESGGEGEGEGGEGNSSGNGFSQCDGNCDGNCSGTGLNSGELSKSQNVIYARVTSPTNIGALFLREKSYGDYTGSGWTHAQPYTKYNYPNYFTSRGMDSINTVNISIRFTGGTSFLMPYYTQSILGTVNDISNTRSGTLALYQVRYTMPVIIGMDYDEIIASNIKANNSFEKEYSKFVSKNYMNVPESTRKALEKLIKENGLSADSSTVVNDVKNYLRNSIIYVNDMADFPEGVDAAVYMLTEAKKGTAQHYATAATLLYRMLGVPARFTTGFLTEPVTNVETPVTGKDAYAWVEVYVDGTGWVMVDVVGMIEGVPTDINGQIMLVRPDGTYYVEMSAANIEKVYDGQPVDAALLNSYNIINGDILNGHYVQMSTGQKLDLINVGVSELDLSELRIIDSNGIDVTEQYYINPNFGKLTIKKRPITVCSQSVTREYDGTALMSDEWWISSGSLVAGHKMEMSMLSQRTMVGTTRNIFTVKKILDENGVDVTAQYDIIEVYGTLTVT